MILNSIIVFLVGIVIGSFLNVSIYRIPKGESISYPGSHCMACQHPLGRFDLIPIVSYLCLKGKCRYCGEKISGRYLFIELITGLSFVAVFLRFGISIEGIIYALFIAVLIVLTMIDYDYMLLPTSVIWSGVILGVFLRIFQTVLHKNPEYLISSLLAAALGYSFFYAVFYMAKLLFKKEGLGFGDVRLIGMLGIYLSIPLILLTIFISSILASIYGIIILYIKKKNEPFPFGPFINLGAVIALFYGYSIITWYLEIVGI